jgi:hypothetical protein
MPWLLALLLFSFQTHIWVYYRVWERITMGAKKNDMWQVHGCEVTWVGIGTLNGWEITKFDVTKWCELSKCQYKGFMFDWGWKTRDEQAKWDDNCASETKGEGRHLGIFWVCVPIYQCNLPLYNLHLVIWRQSSPFRLIISLTTLVTFFTLFDHCVAPRFNSLIMGPFPITSPFKNLWNLDC